MLEVEHANHSKIRRIFGAPKIFNFRGLFRKKIDQKHVLAKIM